MRRNLTVVALGFAVALTAVGAAPVRARAVAAGTAAAAAEGTAVAAGTTAAERLAKARALAAERLAKRDQSLVPPPPALQRAPVTPKANPVIHEVVAPPPATPTAAAAPPVTADDLRKVTAGTSRADLLKLGAPASQLSMFDDGHFTETFRYGNSGQSVGVVRLIDGSVSQIEVK